MYVDDFRNGVTEIKMPDLVVSRTYDFENRNGVTEK